MRVKTVTNVLEESVSEAFDYVVGLNNLEADEMITVRKAALLIGVDKTTINRQARKADLNFPLSVKQLKEMYIRATVTFMFRGAV